MAVSVLLGYLVGNDRGYIKRRKEEWDRQDRRNTQSNGLHIHLDTHQS